MTRLPLRDAAADLLLGSACVGCARPGRVLCRDCRGGLDPQPAPRWPDPVPAGLAVPWAAAEYAGLARALVLGHKERGLRPLREPLALLLAASVQAAVADLAGPVVLVPVPSRPAAIRDRGQDATAVLVRAAARVLRRRGVPATAVPLLAVRGTVADQSGLDADGRFANLDGSMGVRAPRLRRLAAACSAAHAVVCDDVLTTGATAREAQRALEAVGVEVAAAATAAATRRRGPPLPRGRLSCSGWTD
ncbi:ComF family protein [Nocardioides bigeumensis]|uniref:ComF family protein n=1 Tax=Nocardioides bigeumensis TaxID=433657 RepID=A0ABN2YGH2_9ACTN